MKVLNCTGTTKTEESLAAILDVNIKEITKFIDSNKHRVKQNGVCWEYNNFSINDVLNYFKVKPSQLAFSHITIFHIASILDQNSYYNEGLLNLAEIFKRENAANNFLRKYGVFLNEKPNGELVIKHNSNKVEHEFLNHRFMRDRCINGFMFRDAAAMDRNIQHILTCPEFVKNISDAIQLPELRKDWKEAAKPSIISFRVNIHEIDPSTFNSRSSLSDEEIHKFLILKAFEYLLFKNTNYPITSPMIYLKEDISVPSNSIVSITEL